MKSSFVVKKVCKSGDAKIVVIPRKADFELGDYVIIKKINEEYCLSE